MSEPTHKSKSAMRFDVSDNYRESYDRMYGADHKPTRGKWVWDSTRNELVPASEYVPPHASDVHTQISTDRHYENMGATDGTDIGSRRKHQEYMRRNGLAMAEDFKGTWSEAEKNREKFYRGDFDHKARKEALGRAAYELSKRNKKR